MKDNKIFNKYGDPNSILNSRPVNLPIDLQEKEYNLLISDEVIIGYELDYLDDEPLSEDDDYFDDVFYDEFEAGFGKMSVEDLPLSMNNRMNNGMNNGIKSGDTQNNNMIPNEEKIPTTIAKNNNINGDTAPYNIFLNATKRGNTNPFALKKDVVKNDNVKLIDLDSLYETDLDQYLKFDKDVESRFGQLGFKDKPQFGNDLNKEYPTDSYNDNNNANDNINDNAYFPADLDLDFNETFDNDYTNDTTNTSPFDESFNNLQFEDNFNNSSPNFVPSSLNFDNGFSNPQSNFEPRSLNHNENTGFTNAQSNFEPRSLNSIENIGFNSNNSINPPNFESRSLNFNSVDNNGFNNNNQANEFNSFNPQFSSYYPIDNNYSPSPELIGKDEDDNDNMSIDKSYQDVENSNLNHDKVKLDHLCQLLNPSTGKPCNKQFSRPYDLIRHQETIHANKKKIFRCVLCEGRYNGGKGNGKSKTFSRNDALSRHIKVKHGLVGDDALKLINDAKENVEYIEQ